MRTSCKLFLIVMIFTMVNTSIAQEIPRIKENRQTRLEYEYEMYKNPSTNQVPKGIRQKELQFVKSASASLDARFRPESAGRVLADQSWDQRGPFNQAGRTKAIGIDPRNEDIILAGGTSGGMYRTTDGGASWTLVSNPQSNPSITGVAQDPTAQDTWYYITGEGKESVNTNQASQQYTGDGVYKSTDNGVTWSQLTNTKPESTLFGEGLRSDWQLCSDIAIDPIDGAVLIANIGGIYRSADSGTSWTLVLDAEGQANFGDVVHIDVAKVDATSSVYYAGTHSSGTNKGFFRSTDGQAWSDIGKPIGDFGGTWERIRVSIAASNTDVVWFLIHGDALIADGDFTSDVLAKYEYDESSPFWTYLTDKIPNLGGDVGDFNTQGAYNMVMRVKPDDENTVFIGDTKLWRSTDGFTSVANATNTGNTTWVGGYSPDNDVSQYPNHHPDVHELVFFASNPDKVLCGHDGGVSYTEDITTNLTTTKKPDGNPHPVLWSDLNNGMYTTQAYAISIDPTTENSAVIVAGFQDNGNYATDELSGTTDWFEQPHGGDGAWNAVSSGTENWYISQQYGLVERMPAGSQGAHGVNPDTRGSSSTNTFISPFILDRNDDDIMYYTADKELWRNNSISTINENGHPFNGTSEGWTNLNLSGATLSGNITALETSVSPANVVYIGTSTGEVYRIANAHTGSTVTLNDIYTGKGLPNGFVSSIDVDPDNADHVYITFSNYEIFSIFKSSDAGVSWTNISGNLEEEVSEGVPSIDGSGAGPAIRWIHVFKKTDGRNVYLVGATTGLYSTETLSGMTTVWTQEGTSSIGNVPVSMIRSRKVDGYVAVGTHGKGMFSTNILTIDDDVLPTISVKSPADDETGVEWDSDLTITFSENIKDAGGAVILKYAENDSEIESILVNSDQVTIEDAVVTINPTQDLEDGIGYYVMIENDAFKDIAGNKFAGIEDKITWNFTAKAITNVEKPLLENKLNVTVIDHGINLHFLGQTIKQAEIKVYTINGKQGAFTARSSFKNN
ncbi:MAG: Ig-like domain-containing protein, partial [Reichenbachiella sp.]|uniref:Ig-like domain-containing protein n=1 Tax=Reichenbachiella sp. TaxID=2184521 RepID=UPI00329720F0